MTTWCGKVGGHLDVNCWGDGELDFFNWVLMRSKRGSEMGHEILSEHTEGLWSRLKVKGMERK